MSRENTIKLMEVIREKREEIIELSKECYKNTMDGSCFQGWNVGVIADIDGDVYDYYWSQGTSNFALHEGRAVRVISYTSGNDTPRTEDINKEDLSEEEWNKFVEWLLENEYIEDKSEAESALCYKNLYEFEQEYDFGIISRLDEEMIDWCVGEYYREEADSQIDETLNDLQRQLDWEEE